MAKKFFIEITNSEKNETHISEFNQSEIFNSIEACQKFFDDNFVVDDRDDFVVRHWETDQVAIGDDKNRKFYFGTYGRQVVELQKGVNIYLPHENNDQNLVSVSNWIIRVGSDPAISDKLKNRYIVFKDNKALVNWTDKMVKDLRPEAVLRLYALRGQYPVLENQKDDNNIHSLDNPQSVREGQKEFTEHRFFMEGKKGVEIYETKPDTGWLVKSVLTWEEFKTRVSIDDVDVEGKNRAKNITIPSVINGKPVKTIQREGFKDCVNLKTVIIPKSVKSIGKWAFFGCTKLEKVVIPNSVTEIGKWAFRDCTSLNKVCLPKHLTEISTGSFAFCNNLTKIVVPKSVTSIGAWAFRYCNNLKCVVMKNFVPLILKKDSFNNNVPDRKIFVPKESLDDYKQAWTQYKDKIFPIE